MKTFVIGDLHLNHEKIIELCNRPFKDVNEMNEKLIENWNRVVSPKDTVYFLGDLCFEKKDCKRDYWLSRLNGNIILIKGNHDHGKGLIYNIMFKNIFLTHDPYNLKVKPNMVMIHGHQHNKGKLIDKVRRRICVSAELINYTPIELNEILKKYREEK